jgi:hypothetical protein
MTSFEILRAVTQQYIKKPAKHPPAVASGQRRSKNVAKRKAAPAKRAKWR